MKFEANIPSYLRTGAGVFPVKDKPMPKRIESSNFYEMAKQGFDMPVANETRMPAFAPVETGKVANPRNTVNFLDEMQMNMARKPLKGQGTLDMDLPVKMKPQSSLEQEEIRQIELENQKSLDELDDDLPDNETKLDAQDIFIG